MKYYFLILSLIHMVKCDQEYLIKDGEEAKIEQFPHSAYLKVMINNEKKSIFSCGASIVNQRILLTAAQCIEHCTSRCQISVAVGRSNKKEGLLSSVHSFVPYPDYKPTTFHCDIALLALRTDLKFSKRVQRVALMSDPPYHEKAQVAGWGETTKAGQASDKLNFMDQYVWNTSDCFVKKNRLGVFCASSKNEATGSRGDSGSALVVRGYIQIGLVSYKIPSVSPSMVVYTDTGYYYKWIRKTAKKLYCHVEKKP